jgi:hypothetical protein
VSALWHFQLRVDLHRDANGRRKFFLKKKSQHVVNWVACRLRHSDQIILVCDGPVCFRIAILGSDTFVPI